MGGLVREDSTVEGRRIWKLVKKVAAAAPKDAALQSDNLGIGAFAGNASAKEIARSGRRRRGR